MIIVIMVVTPTSIKIPRIVFSYTLVATAVFEVTLL